MCSVVRAAGGEVQGGGLQIEAKARLKSLLGRFEDAAKMSRSDEHYCNGEAKAKIAMMLGSRAVYTKKKRG